MRVHFLQSPISYAYDAANQLTSETSGIQNQASRIVSYTYDADGNRATTTYPDGTALGYGYTERNQLASVTAGSPPPLATYTYTTGASERSGEIRQRRTRKGETSRSERVNCPLAGKRLTRTLENGVTTSGSYDAASRLLGLAHTHPAGPLASVVYALNAVGNRTSRTEGSAGVPPVTDAYSYDTVDQVTGVAYGSGRTVSYDYDPVGNRATVTESGTSTPYTANALNQYTAIDGLSAPAYDANGNLTSIQHPGSSNVAAYTYDVYGMPAITGTSGLSLPVSGFGNRFAFTGREWLADIGLYDYRNRAYSPQVGRWLQTDPIRFEAGDVNIYRAFRNLSGLNTRYPFGLHCYDCDGLFNDCTDDAYKKSNEGVDMAGEWYHAEKEAIDFAQEAWINSANKGCDMLGGRTPASNSMQNGNRKIRWGRICASLCSLGCSICYKVRVCSWISRWRA